MFASKGKPEKLVKKINKRRMKMKIYMTRINGEERVSNSQIATSKDGKLVFVRMSFIKR